MSASQLRRYRGGRCAMIFQEPLLAFDPVYTVGQQIIEGLRRHEGLSRQAARDRALEALRQVRIPSPSGGWMLTRTRCPAGCASGR
ncbi:Oligopeptide transport ATP-binding protein OppD [Klebsiella pneumoniae]|uniref:Oligopeptide transport ATP-binding protein OppD n=1 Tax=Klebsiella pneumoniae TaxID=573 RepID=A0A378F9G7_KLEPN|nr:Oligopeptide transport ATP-binding protein OppD [Klebsiella pneumoniae]